MKKSKLLLLGIATIALTCVVYISEMFAKVASVACVTGLGEIPVPESLRDE